MSTNHEYTPTVQDLMTAWTVPGQRLREVNERGTSGWERAQEAQRAIDAIIAAAEQRGAVRALREAATRLRDSKFANSVKPPHEKVQVPESDWLERRADRMETRNETH